MNTGCDSCHNEQRSLNDIFQQAIIDAKKLSNEQNSKVAVIQEGPNYLIRAFSGQTPSGSRAVVTPGQ